jgi:hypothetical protein
MKTENRIIERLDKLGSSLKQNHIYRTLVDGIHGVDKLVDAMPKRTINRIITIVMAVYTFVDLLLYVFNTR